eukprot:759926_1
MLDCTRYPAGPPPVIDYNSINIGHNAIRSWKTKEYPQKSDIRTEMRRQIIQMLKVGLIRKSNSPYVSPDINQLLAKFRGKNIITSLDMRGGYWHIPIFEPHKERTAFIFDGNVYEWNFMPFGPCNAPAYFQQVMNELFGHLGFIVDKYGIRPTKKYKQKIFNVPRPNTKPALQRFIGLVQY